MDKVRNNNTNVYKLIELAFANAQKNLSGNSSLIAPLYKLEHLFPSPLVTSLSKLAMLTAPQPLKSAEATDTRLRVILGVGAEFSKDHDLFSFFDAMLVFQSEQSFYSFMQHGYSLVIRGGAHNKKVAAAAFTVWPDGLFLDAIIVSHGVHPNPCKLSGHADKSFQRCGLGSFLLALLLCVATVQCTIRPSVILKKNQCLSKFYTDRHFLPIENNTVFPIDLAGGVPMVNCETGSKTTLLVFYPPAQDAQRTLPTTTNPEAALPNTQDKAAAVQLAELKATTE
jgi:hypothetical protein